MDGNKKSDGVCQAYWMKVTNGTVYVIEVFTELYMNSKRNPHTRDPMKQPNSTLLLMLTRYRTRKLHEHSITQRKDPMTTNKYNKSHEQQWSGLCITTIISRLTRGCSKRTKKNWHTEFEKPKNYIKVAKVSMEIHNRDKECIYSLSRSKH